MGAQSCAPIKLTPYQVKDDLVVIYLQAMSQTADPLQMAPSYYRIAEIKVSS